MTSGPHRIVVGYDGSAAARRALAQAADLAGYGSMLTVITVTAAGEGATTSPLEEAKQTLARRHLVGRYMAPAGDPATALVDAARGLRADLLVVGKRNGGGGAHALGSVSARVVTEAPCDVLLVG